MDPTEIHTHHVPAGYCLAARDHPALPSGRPVARLAAMPPPDRAADPYRLDVDDWLRLPEMPGLQEIIDGELWLMAPPAIDHQRISARLALAIGSHLQASGQGELFTAPTGVRLLDRDNLVEPDLLVVSAENGGRVGEKYVDGPPDLVVEILSRGNARRDRVVKRRLYERAGVPEYWIVDPLAGLVRVLRRTPRGRTTAALKTVDRLGRGDVLTTPVLPDLEVSLDEVFAGIYPAVSAEPETDPDPAG